MITSAQLQKITNISDTIKLGQLTTALNDTASKFNINTLQRFRHFLAQIMVESEVFTATVENLNYSAQALLATFPTHFNAAQAAAYARQPEKIGNRAYANRMGNGDEASGDGYLYRGRGFIMCTGKINYLATGKALGIDLITHPELLQQPEYAMESAGFFWSENNLNAVADKCGDDVTRITKIINGGINGLQMREKSYDICKKILI